MDSPAFGTLSKNNKMFKHSVPAKDDNDIQNAQFALVLMTLQKNVRKFIQSIIKVEKNRKRSAYNGIRNVNIISNNSPYMYTANQLSLILDIDRKLSSVAFFIQQSETKLKISAFRKIISIGSIITGSKRQQSRQEFRSNSQKAGKKTEEWKQNTFSNSEILQQNKKLKSQIQKQQFDQESFIQKMKDLLESHQKQRTKPHVKKKK